MRRPRIPRPSPRRLGAAVVVLGLVAGLAFLVLPVEASLDDDPLIGLVPFSPALGQAVARVDCGAPVGNFGRSPTDPSLPSLARHGVCRDAATKRAATALAATAALGVLGLITLAGARTREPAVA